MVGSTAASLLLAIETWMTSKLVSLVIPASLCPVATLVVLLLRALCAATCRALRVLHGNTLIRSDKYILADNAGGIALTAVPSKPNSTLVCYSQLPTTRGPPVSRCSLLKLTPAFALSSSRQSIVLSNVTMAVSLAQGGPYKPIVCSRTASPVGVSCQVVMLPVPVPPPTRAPTLPQLTYNGNAAWA